MWRRIGLLLQVLLGGLALVWIASLNHLEIDRVVLHLQQIDWRLLLAGVGCFVATMLLTAWRYYLFLPAHIPYRYLVGVVFFQNALLTFVPLRMGEVGYPWLLRRDFNIPLASSTGVIVSIRMTDLAVVLAVALAGSPLLQFGANWLISGVLGLILFAGALSVLWLRWRWRVPALVQTFVVAVRPLRQPGRLLRFMALSVVVFGVTTVQSKLVFQSLALDLPVGSVAVLNALTLLAALLPIHPPGGWGTIDSVQTLIISRLGYDPAQALPAILATHSIYTVIILGGGLVGWLLRTTGRTGLQPTSSA